MPKPVAPEARRAWIAALGIVGAITALRLALLAMSEMDLFVDEAQYWLWGQNLAFGYYSKPPLIGWVIGAVTSLAGSDAPFWVRLPAPLAHAATAVILAAVAGRPFGPRVVAPVAAAYATLPMVAVGSLLISTDTIMFPPLALALGGYLACLRGGGMLMAAATGAALGLAFMAKYAAIYYLPCAALAALMVPEARPRPRDAALVVAVAALMAAPNIVWNLQNGLATLAHTADNAGWVRAGAALRPGALAAFFLSQFAVFGPVLFAALIALAARAGNGAATRTLLWFSLPIVALICGQALLSGAYANWAAAAYLAGTLAVVPALARGARPLLALSFAVNGAVTLALPLAGVFAESLRIDDGPPLLARYLGRDEMSRAIIAAARAAGIDTVVAADRDILADLFYTGRDSGLRFYARPEAGRAPNHYALNFPLPTDATGRALFVSDSDRAPPCVAGASPVASIAGTGVYGGDTKHLFAVPAGCWRAGQAL